MQDICELGKEVAVGDVSKELRRLWEVDEARTNASLMNLVIYSEVPGRLLANSDLARTLTRSHACRAILISMDRGTDEASIRAWITAHCNLAYGRKTVCCEQVAFSLTGKAVGRLRNTLFAHLHSDLPVVFWWQGDFSSVFQEDLYRLLDRLLFDSSDWNEPLEGLAVVERALARTNGKLVVQDLAWTRSYHIRLALAGLFDDPVAQAALPELTKVEVTGSPKHRTTGLLLLAWLATQSRWQLDGKGSFRTPFGTRVDYAFVPVEGSAAISEVSLTGGETALRVQHQSGTEQIHAELTSPCHCVHLPLPADPEASVQLVAQQLSRGGKNSLYRKVLPVFRALLELGA